MISTDDCWLYAGTKDVRGYGTINLKPHQYVHRIVYESLIGEIPVGLVIDHLCRVRHCVNPDHLEAVTNAENVLRGEGTGAKNRVKTHCKNGHSLEGKNLIIYGNKRKCRICHYRSVNKGRSSRPS